MSEAPHRRTVEIQITEGNFVYYDPNNLEKCITEPPVDVKKISVFIGQDGRYHWHLLPDCIDDPVIAERVKHQMQIWLGLRYSP